MYWVFKLLTGKEGMGYGDFKLLGALGAWLGWQDLPIVILLSSVVGAVIGIAYLTSQQSKIKANQFHLVLTSPIAGWITFLYGDADR